MPYRQQLLSIQPLTFDAIIAFNQQRVPYPYNLSPWKHPALNHGVAVLSTEEACCAYIAAYGRMHQAKINEVLAQISIETFITGDIQIIDWGCGQGLASICLFDHLQQKNLPLSCIQKVILIEPSTIALERATNHVAAYLGDYDKIIPIQKYLDDVTEEEITSTQPITIHLFSNILDIPSIDLFQLAKKLKSSLYGQHYFFCWSPLNYGNHRIDTFSNYFPEANSIYSNFHAKQLFDTNGNIIQTYGYTAKNRVFKINRDECELIFVDYYLPKQFHAAYQLDAVRKALQNIDEEQVESLYKNLSEFEIQTPFDIGASIYDDVHPVLAVLNNIITRGLPTKASPFIENAFQDFGNKPLTNNALGGIEYNMDSLNPDDLFLALHLIDSRWTLTQDNYNTPILDSDLETTYITQIAHPILRQILQPQRTLSSINTTIQNHSRVDFACEFPYPTRNPDDNIFYHGCVVELDGNRYHTNAAQQNIDQIRNHALVTAQWDYKRLSENDMHIPFEQYNNLGSEYVTNCLQSYQKSFNQQWTNTLQMVLSPIAVARLEKTIVEALMTERLRMDAASWKILVIEHDVPCAALAFEDLRQMFGHITLLSADYADMKFPQVDLTIVSTKEFAQSPLHLGRSVYTDPYRSNTEYDIVIDFAILRRSGLEQINFTDYHCKNRCYFNIRSAHYHRNERQIYTTDRIIYKSIASVDSQGHYTPKEENVKHLQYFLQLLFRKQDFRPGQIPILNRALQYQSVIGLLPTGGGKSLTYQIAAMLQPGVTLIIDPLRSLMKDQFDGLINAGIDYCSYINSSIEVPAAIQQQGSSAVIRYRREERERRSKRLEQAEFLFMFLSPERLSILHFRERLKNMRDTGVYFSYGVIDEVHCVSEWGHDFRFTYLHLGRNLYNYVLPKQRSDDATHHIPLFGLTATASFDVLADVERELSGNGAFPLDAETIVRENDTNRVEIQYKIEPIPVTFPVNNRGVLNLSHWAIYEAKQAQLNRLIDHLPAYLRDLLSENSIQRIIEGYTSGPRAKEDVQIPLLQVDIPQNFLNQEDSYEYGGIVFCPHKNNTGIAVLPNRDALTEQYATPIGIFVGSSDETTPTHAEDLEAESIQNLELFRNNQLSLMVATKAFGMGIDKPNVRYTINMNFSSSLESFVQEAGRAGRDRRMALSVIMLSRYRIAKVKSNSPHYRDNQHNWYDVNNLETIARNKNIPIEDFEIYDETSDLVKLKCKQCGDYCKRFEWNCCQYGCGRYDICNLQQRDNSCRQPCPHRHDCALSHVQSQERWGRYDRLNTFKEKYTLTPENYEYLHADYGTVMYFYNNNFKGEEAENGYMHRLLSQEETRIDIENEHHQQIEHHDTVAGFLTTLLNTDNGNKVISFIHYQATEKADIEKAIYRMCCVGVIDDFTHDYNNNQFRIVSTKLADGEYYKALEQYLTRYYTAERAAELIQEVHTYREENEIHKCLGYLTHFIYDKIAVKRKRAIDDMFAFCLHGVDNDRDWKEINEELKDDLFFYFNSKYARKGYTTESGHHFSLVDDTKEGKFSSPELLFKYLQVVDNQWIAHHSEAGSTQIDNAKHLYGAVRLIRRSLTDTNPTIDLLGAFCLMFLGTNHNEALRKELDELYSDGMLGFRTQCQRNIFWNDVYYKFHKNPYVSIYFNDNGGFVKSWSILKIHQLEVSNLKDKYLSDEEGKDEQIIN